MFPGPTAKMGDSRLMQPFVPIVRNPHALTILGNFWPRGYDFAPFPENRRLIQTDPDTQVLVVSQHPVTAPLGQVVLLHGLEGSSDAGYMRSLAWQTLSAGFITHRFHMRTCGGTAHLCKTLYHGGLTSDLREFLKLARSEQPNLPIFPIGFSLGGNVSLKLAGEEGESGLIDGVFAVSVPIDLAACARRIGQSDNIIYERRFLSRMKERVIATGRYTAADVAGCDSLWEIDDRITAPSFGFEGAAHYYRTQSSQNFLDAIRVPATIIQSRDDTFIPFEIFGHPAIAGNPRITLIPTDHGGHLGFVSRQNPRFWVDQTVLGILTKLVPTPRPVGRSIECGA